MLWYSVGFGQVDIESLARLHFTIESEPNNWFEGYSSILSGSFSPYSSHRSGAHRDSAFVARTSGEESMIEWSPASVPRSWRGDSASFLWVCGFGNNLGNEWFDQITSIQVAGKNVDTIHWDQINRQRLRAFLEEQVECERYVFPPGEFPEVRWKRPAMVDNEMGKFSLKVVYYDKNMRQVTRAEKTGRYAAVVEGQLPSGFTTRRFITLYCSPVEFDDYSENIPVKFNQLKSYGISKVQWQLYEQSENRFAFGAMKMLPIHDADAAVFLAGLSELDSVASGTDTPRLRDRQWWIAFKQTLYGKNAALLSLPKKENTASLLLDERPASTSPFTQEHLTQIRNVCRAWATDAAEPHVTLIAYKGRLVFHEAFNTKTSNPKLNLDSPLWMASITKLLTGVLMMQFVDQGCIGLDAPIEKYLPELSSAIETKLTVRHLFTHTTGLDDWAGEWASDWNPALENYIAQVLPFTNVGKKFSYNRVGYAIAGKLMERITGRAVPYLFQDYLFTPLGMKSAYADNTYGGLYCTAIDLARLGQVLLNRGTYNGYKFFSEDSYHQMLPAKLAGIDRRWGIGTSPMEGHGLSGEAFGHAAASGAVFCIDPKNDLIIISARNRIGSSGKQEEFEKRLIEACTAPFRHD